MDQEKILALAKLFRELYATDFPLTQPALSRYSFLLKKTYILVDKLFNGDRQRSVKFKNYKSKETIIASFIPENEKIHVNTSWIYKQLKEIQEKIIKHSNNKQAVDNLQNSKANALLNFMLAAPHERRHEAQNLLIKNAHPELLTKKQRISKISTKNNDEIKAEFSQDRIAQITDFYQMVELNNEYLIPLECFLNAFSSQSGIFRTITKNFVGNKLRSLLKFTVKNSDSLYSTGSIELDARYHTVTKIAELQNSIIKMKMQPAYSEQEKQDLEFLFTCLKKHRKRLVHSEYALIHHTELDALNFLFSAITSDDIVKYISLYKLYSGNNINSKRHISHDKKVLDKFYYNYFLRDFMSDRESIQKLSTKLSAEGFLVASKILDQYPPLKPRHENTQDIKSSVPLIIKEISRIYRVCHLLTYDILLPIKDDDLLLNLSAENYKAFDAFFIRLIEKQAEKLFKTHKELFDENDLKHIEDISSLYAEKFNLNQSGDTSATGVSLAYIKSVPIYLTKLKELTEKELEARNDQEDSI